MILHVDMDAFYASVEERERPELAGRPLIVGGTPEGRGVVAAANYEVRKYGVHSAMPTSKALRLCPQAIVLPPRLGYYAEVSEQIRAVFDRYTPLVEPLSLDEAFLDVTGSEPLFGSSVAIGREIKQTIRDQLRLTASVGVAPNKFLAKIASDLQKPDGFVVVEDDQVQDFLGPLPVGRLWGVGRVANQVFDRLGIKTIGDVRRMPVDVLHRHFGQMGEHLFQLSRGVDERRVVPDRDAKSISHETTFATDIDDLEALRAWVAELAEQVAWRLRHYTIETFIAEMERRIEKTAARQRARQDDHAARSLQGRRPASDRHGDALSVAAKRDPARYLNCHAFAGMTAELFANFRTPAPPARKSAA